MAWRDMGRGEPWLLLHGGPGSGCSPALLAPFDLARQRVIAPDQRGAGDSRPSGRTAANHLAALVADLEALRRHLGLERWSLLGGSWGTVVALAYARQHPDHVARLVLRGAFGLTRSEVGGLLLPSARPGKRVAQGDWPVPHGAALPQALSGLSQLLQSGAVTVPSLQAGRGWALRERRDALHGLLRSLRHLSGKDATAQRRLWAGLQRQQRRALARLRQPRATPADRQAQARYRLQAHYLRHRGFVRPGELDAAVLALAGADTAKVKAHHFPAGLHKSTRQSLHHFVVHGAAKQRVRMGDDRHAPGCARRAIAQGFNEAGRAGEGEAFSVSVQLQLPIS